MWPKLWILWVSGLGRFRIRLGWCALDVVNEGRSRSRVALHARPSETSTRWLRGATSGPAQTGLDDWLTEVTSCAADRCPETFVHRSSLRRDCDLLLPPPLARGRPIPDKPTGAGRVTSTRTMMVGRATMPSPYSSTRTTTAPSSCRTYTPCSLASRTI